LDKLLVKVKRYFLIIKLSIIKILQYQGENHQESRQSIVQNGIPNLRAGNEIANSGRNF
jgi:hypothetical protein